MIVTGLKTYLSLIGVSMIGCVSAATVFHSDETSWLAAANGAVSTQDFDANGVFASYTTSGGTSSVGFDLDIDHYADNAPDSTGADNFSTGASGRGIRVFGNASDGVDGPDGIDGIDVVTFTITGGDVYSFSLNVHDLFDTSPVGAYGFNVEVQATGGVFQQVFAVTSEVGGSTVNFVNGLGGNGSGLVDYTAGSTTGSVEFGQDGSGNVGDGVFLGFTGTDTIEAIRFTKNTINGATDNWGFDNFNVVSTAAIPEPSGAMLLGLGFVGAVFCRRRYSE